QKEFLRAKHVKRSLDLQLGTGGRNVEHDAASPPRTIDAHQVHRVAVLETNPVRFPLAIAHQPAPSIGRSAVIASRSASRRSIRVDGAAPARMTRSRSAISSADAIAAMGCAWF